MASALTERPARASGRLAPLTVFTLPGLTSATFSFIGTTWKVSTLFSRSLFAASSPIVFAGTVLNASLVGANTVKGPAPASVSVSPASLINPLRVDRLGSDAMTWDTVRGCMEAQPIMDTDSRLSSNTRRFISSPLARRRPEGTQAAEERNAKAPE